MLNISGGGMAFLTKYDIPVWSVLIIKLCLFKSDEYGLVGLSNPVEISAEVRSNVVSERGEYRLGVCFKEAYSETRSAVSSFVESMGRL